MPNFDEFHPATCRRLKAAEFDTEGSQFGDGFFVIDIQFVAVVPGKD
jgi:hypothetical protein